MFIDLSEYEQEPGSSQSNTSDDDDLAAEFMDFFNEDDEEPGEEAAPPQNLTWSQLNDHASAHQAQWGDKVFESCEQCLQHREGLRAWGAEKAKKKVKGEAIGYGSMTEEEKEEMQRVMMRRAGLAKKARNREIYEGR